MNGEEKFHDEISLLQAAQREATRWKIIGFRALAAIGLGIDGTSNRDMILVRCLIPLFAPYCDLISREYEIRIARLLYTATASLMPRCEFYMLRINANISA
jgi:hypothetical protein